MYISMSFEDTPETRGHYDSLAGALLADPTLGLNELDRRAAEIAHVNPTFAADVETIVEQVGDDPRLLSLAHRALDDICEVLAA